MEKNLCVVCEYGWIIVGVEDGTDEEYLFMKNASVVRNWTNGRGIGAIAKPEYKDEYQLDPIGDGNIRSSKVLFEIPCEW